VAATLRDAHALALGADHIIMNWGFDENLPMLAGTAAESAMGCAPWAFFGQNVKLMDKVVEYAQKYNPGIPPEKRTIHTVQAWGNVLGLAEALKRADKAGNLSGESILKKGFETMTDFEIGLGLAPVSFSGTDHRPQSKVKVYEFKSGKFALLDEVDLKTRWPDKWKNEWIGW
jgi:branched-chain amino acid transport system substrate-binding protein